jgi:hypothetical protein
MLARLWWKETRLFWPLWLCVAVFAAATQWLLLKVGVEEARIGMLSTVALGWTVLYAFAVSSAAFAGERETNTLVLLDVLPVSRSMLWRSKLGFALASTFGLALVLMLMASAGTVQRNADFFGYESILIGFGSLLIETVAWGLFWSAIAGDALTAAVLAVATVGAISALLSGPQLDVLLAEWLVGQNGRGVLPSSRDFSLANPVLLTATALPRLAIALVAVALSRALIVRRPRPNRPLRVQPVAPTPGPQPLRRTRFAVARRLTWQTLREAWRVWRILVPIAIGVTVLMLRNSPGRDSLAGVIYLVGSAVSLIAGVNVFAADNRGRTARFYCHHGVRPAAVWLVKETIWGAGLAGFLFLLLFVPLLFYHSISGLDLSLALLVIVNVFCIGQLCGLLIRRGITAAAVAFLLALLLVPPQIVLLEYDFVPRWTGALIPLILLGVSWAWSGEWMLDRPEPSRWVKLGMLLAVPFALLVAGFIAYRGWSLPDIGRPFPRSEVALAPIPPDENAAEVYQRAMEAPGFSTTVTRSREFGEDLERVLKEGWDPKASSLVGWWEKNQETIATIRRAAAMPRAQFQRVERMTYETTFPPVLQSVGMPSLARLMALDARERLARGDVAGACDDIRVILRMAEQVGQGPVPFIQALIASNIHSQAMNLAMDWVEDPHQTADLLRKAREELPPLPKPSMVLKAESTILDQTLRPPADDLRTVLHDVGGNRAKAGPLERSVYFLLLAPPWERQRAIRLNRLLTADLLQYIDREPSQRRALALSNRYVAPVIDLDWPPNRPVWRLSASALERAQAGTPLLHFLWPNFGALTDTINRQEVLRRAFVLRSALRSWQLKHGGKLPESLGELVPSELPRLPLDPYSGESFRYIRSGERNLVPFLPEGRATRPVLIREGQWLLYSVGYDGKDDGGAGRSDTTSQGDFVFPISEPASL